MADFDIKELIAKAHFNYVGPAFPTWWANNKKFFVFPSLSKIGSALLSGGQYFQTLKVAYKGEEFEFPNEPLISLSQTKTIVETATVNITVSPVADIVDDYLSLDAGTSVTANVLTGTNGASSDNFESTVTLIGVTNATYGTVTFSPNGEITYTPYANYLSGIDTFTYTIQTQDSNGVTTTETGTIEVEVYPVAQNQDVLSTLVPDSSVPTEINNNPEQSDSDNGNVIDPNTSAVEESNIIADADNSTEATSENNSTQTESQTENNTVTDSEEMLAQQQVAQQESFAAQVQSSSQNNDNTSSSSNNESSSDNSESSDGGSSVIQQVTTLANEAITIVAQTLNNAVEYGVANPEVAAGTIVAGALPGAISAFSGASTATTAMQSASSAASHASSASKLSHSAKMKTNVSAEKKKSDNAKLHKMDAEFEQSEEREAMEVCMCPACQSIKTYGPKTKGEESL